MTISSPSIQLTSLRKQGYFIGADVPKEDPRAGTFLTGPNFWPKSLPREEFEVPLMNYRGRMEELAKLVLKILALGLPNVSPNLFDEFMTNASGNLRLLHYPPQLVLDERQLGGKLLSRCFFECSRCFLLLPSLTRYSGSTYRLWRHHISPAATGHKRPRSLLSTHPSVDPRSGTRELIRRQHRRLAADVDGGLLPQCQTPSHQLWREAPL
jgi:hypothetical protein